MKKAIPVTLCLLAVLALCGSVFPVDAKMTAPNCSIHNILPVRGSGEMIAKRGCCSWHDGVCGCSGGRIQCCDGSTSPTCTCNHDDKPTLTLAWSGYDYEKGDFVEIDTGNLVRSGNDIEFFDYNDGSYHNADVESIHRSGSTVDVDVYDQDNGEYRTLEMDD